MQNQYSSIHQFFAIESSVQKIDNEFRKGLIERPAETLLSVYATCVIISIESDFSNTNLRTQSRYEVSKTLINEERPMTSLYYVISTISHLPSYSTCELRQSSSDCNSRPKLSPVTSSLKELQSSGCLAVSLLGLLTESHQSFAL